MLNSINVLLEKIILEEMYFLLVTCRRHLLLLTFFFAGFCHAASGSVNATATLSRNRVAAGEVVELEPHWPSVIGPVKLERHWPDGGVGARGGGVQVLGEVVELEPTHYHSLSLIITHYHCAVYRYWVS